MCGIDKETASIAFRELVATGFLDCVKPARPMGRNWSLPDGGWNTWMRPDRRASKQQVLARERWLRAEIGAELAYGIPSRMYGNPVR